MSQEVARTSGNGLTALDVHRVVNHLTADFGEVVLGDGGDDRRLLAAINPAQGVAAGSFEQVSRSADSGHGFHDAFKATDRDAKLLANSAVSGNHFGNGFCATR